MKQCWGLGADFCLSQQVPRDLLDGGGLTLQNTTPRTGADIRAHEEEKSAPCPVTCSQGYSASNSFRNSLTPWSPKLQMVKTVIIYTVRILRLFLVRIRPLEDSFTHEFTQQIILRTCPVRLLLSSEDKQLSEANRSWHSL